MKFKVGDKVRVKEDLVSGNYYGNIYFAQSMKEYRGKIFTIRTIDGGIYSLDGCKFISAMREESEFWDFSDEMLEPVVGEDLAQENVISQSDRSIVFDKIVSEYNPSIIDTVLINKVKDLLLDISNSYEMQVMTDALVTLMAYQEEEMRNNG